jgi:hypothetical protein
VLDVRGSRVLKNEAPGQFHSRLRSIRYDGVKALPPPGHVSQRPRDLWATCYPETDIWSTKNVSRRGKLVLTAEDVRGEGSKRLQSMYEAQVRRTRRPVLVDKLPINNFRLEFLHVIFPGAQYSTLSAMERSA